MSIVWYESLASYSHNAVGSVCTAKVHYGAPHTLEEYVQQATLSFLACVRGSHRL